MSVSNEALFVEPMNEVERTVQERLETSKTDDWHAKLRLIFKLEEETLRRCGIVATPLNPAPRKRWRP